LRRKGNLADEIKELMNDKTKLKKYIEELGGTQKSIYICNNNDINDMKTEILKGTEQRLYRLVAPLAMNPHVIAQNNGVAFKTSDKHVYIVAIEYHDELVHDELVGDEIYTTEKCIGFIPVQLKKNNTEGYINNYYIKNREKKVFTSLVKETIKYAKKEKMNILYIISQKQDYTSLQKLKFIVEKPFIRYTKFKLNLK
jgi:hypothetical protein